MQPGFAVEVLALEAQVLWGVPLQRIVFPLRASPCAELAESSYAVKAIMSSKVILLLNTFHSIYGQFPIDAR